VASLIRQIQTPFGMVEATIHDGRSAHLGLSGNSKLRFRDRDWYFAGNVHIVDGDWVWYTLSGCRPNVSDPYKLNGKEQAPPTFREKILAGILESWEDYVAENPHDLEEAQRLRHAAQVASAQHNVREAIDNLVRAAGVLTELGASSPSLSLALDVLQLPPDSEIVILGYNDANNADRVHLPFGVAIKDR
jgi:hypothetical protein